MIRDFKTPCFLSAVFACLLVTFAPGEANANTMGYIVELTPRVGFFDPNFGSGVSAGDVFTGHIYFDSSDLTPDGARPRSILPGGDELTIAGVSFDSLLNSTFWSFSIFWGEPLCFDTGIGGGCGTGTSQINFDNPSSPYPAISFTDTFLGTAFDSKQLSMGFMYSIRPIPVPAAAWLLGSGMIGLLAVVGCNRTRS